jgi:hypothetical protein
MAATLRVFLRSITLPFVMLPFVMVGTEAADLRGVVDP